MNKIISNARLWTGESAIENACVQITGDTISYAGSQAEAPVFQPDEVIDAKNCIVMPGLVNAHTHLPMTMVRGVGTDLPLMDWLHTIWPLEDKMTPEMMKLGTQMSMLEGIRTGTTCMADGYTMSEIIAKTVAEGGMRANIARMMTGDTESGKLAEQRALFEHWNDAADGLIKIYVGLHAEYTSEERFVRALADLAAELETGIHVHVSETKSETEECRGRRAGRTPVEYLADAGVFDVPAIAAHCVWVNDNDIAIMKAKNVSPIHNPVSNLKLASGIAPVEKMRLAGLNVGLGTDGAASNNTMDMFEELKLTAILQKGATNIATAMPATGALKISSENGARALGFVDCGLLKAGYKADIVMTGDSNPAHTAARDIPGTLVYATSGADVRMTMVNGRVLYMDGEFKTMDAEKIRAQFAAAVDDLLGR